MDIYGVDEPDDKQNNGESITQASSGNEDIVWNEVE